MRRLFRSRRTRYIRTSSPFRPHRATRLRRTIWHRCIRSCGGVWRTCRRNVRWLPVVPFRLRPYPNRWPRISWYRRRPPDRTATRCRRFSRALRPSRGSRRIRTRRNWRPGASSPPRRCGDPPRRGTSVPRNRE